MRIMVIGINPSTNEYTKKHLVEAGEAFLNSIKGPDTELGFAWPTRGAQLPDQWYWESMDSSHTVQLINQVDESVYDGVIIWCMLDPCLQAAKERLNIPVVGLLQSSLGLACNLGRRISIITPRNTSCAVPDNRGAPGGNIEMMDKVRLYGLDRMVVSIRSTSITGLEFDTTLEEQREAALVAARQAVEQDGADIIILGCSGMLETADYLREKLGVPAIDPSFAALRTCETLISMGLSQSKTAYPLPNLERMVVQD